MNKIKKALAVFLTLIIMSTCVPFNAYAVSEATLKDKLISIAANEVGYQGGSGGYTKYGEWYGYQGAWCTTFVLWCYYKTGLAYNVKLYGTIVPNGGNCNSMISWYQNKGRYHTRESGYTPKKGDLVFFDWSGNGSSQHVGLVSSTSGSTINTIEGNCSNKVKRHTYTKSGSKPYGSIYSILGYGSPNWSAYTDGSGEKETTTKKKHKKKKKVTTTKQETTTKKNHKKKKNKSATDTTNEKTTKETTETTTKETTTKKPTTKAVVAKDMKLHAATTELEIGDSVTLDYTIEPLGAQAVVGYFCDEENIIEISKGGVITATGEGKATVVVCANDEIYRQCDFNVTEASSRVTRHTPNSIEIDTTKPEINEKSFSQKLSDIGVNADQLEAHYRYYIYPVAIICTTAVLAGIIVAIKALARAIRKKRDAKAEGEE
ncbi:MAG: CHAP domain-containing protein [Eubacterium sp.]|nr:CHAP domain-containing protein [Eubacterium sp.]